MSTINNIKNAFFKSIHLKSVPDLSKLNLEQNKHNDAFFLCQRLPFYEELPVTYGGIGTYDEIKSFFNKETFFEDIYMKDYSISRDSNGNMRGLITSKSETAYFGLHIDNLKYMAADVVFRFSSRGLGHYDTMKLMSERKYQLICLRSSTEKTSVTDEEMELSYDTNSQGFTIQPDDYKYDSFVRQFIVDRRLPIQNTPWIFLKIDNNGIEERIEDLIVEIIFMSQIVDSEGTVLTEAINNMFAVDPNITGYSTPWPNLNMKSITYDNKKLPYFSSYTPNMGYTSVQVIDLSQYVSSGTRAFEIDLKLNLENGNNFYIVATDYTSNMSFKSAIERNEYEDHKVESMDGKFTIHVGPENGSLCFCLRNNGDDTFNEIAESFCLLRGIRDITPV